MLPLKTFFSFSFPLSIRAVFSVADNDHNLRHLRCGHQVQAVRFLRVVLVLQAVHHLLVVLVVRVAMIQCLRAVLGRRVVQVGRLDRAGLLELGLGEPLLLVRVVLGLRAVRFLLTGREVPVVRAGNVQVLVFLLEVQVDRVVPDHRDYLAVPAGLLSTGACKWIQMTLPPHDRLHRALRACRDVRLSLVVPGFRVHRGLPELLDCTNKIVAEPVPDMTVAAELVPGMTVAAADGTVEDRLHSRAYLDVRLSYVGPFRTHAKAPGFGVDRSLDHLAVKPERIACSYRAWGHRSQRSGQRPYR